MQNFQIKKKTKKINFCSDDLFTFTHQNNVLLFDITPKSFKS